MAGDLANLKSGQQPTGINIPRKIEEKPPIPAPIPPRPGVVPPAPGSRISTIELGREEKARNISPSGPLPAPFGPPKIIPPPQIVIPEGGPKGGSRTMLFVGIAVVLVLVAAGYWFFFLRSSTPAVVESPTPVAESTTPTPTPIPVLSDIFTAPKQDVNLPESGNPLTSFNNSVKTATVSAQTIVPLNLTTPVNNLPVALSLGDVLGRFLINYPQELQTAFLQNDSNVSLYGQTEIFDKKGALLPTAPAQRRLVMIVEIKDLTGINAALTNWEATMPSDLNTLFQLNFKKGAKAVFNDNTYDGTAIRFVNFPWPDRSIDYALVSAFNGKTYLVIANSRQSAYATIDKLKGL